MAGYPASTIPDEILVNIEAIENFLFLPCRQPSVCYWTKQLPMAAKSLNLVDPSNPYQRVGIDVCQTMNWEEQTKGTRESMSCFAQRLRDAQTDQWPFPWSFRLSLMVFSTITIRGPRARTSERNFKVPQQVPRQVPCID